MDSINRSLLAALAFLLLPPAAIKAGLPGYAPHSANPILPGYFADPTMVRQGNNTYIYATLDPWGGETLGCWESPDLKNWTYHVLNWPTKRACTSPRSLASMVWAPSVVHAPDGKFYMYVSVGSEVWAGAADHPLGPWRNLLGDKPLIPENFRPGFHMIDAEGYIDEDGQAYLYWGSGLNWKNGRCWAVKLKPDMAAFDGEVHDVTPANYFEAPFMMKHGGRYFLMYSHGKTVADTYQIHYATGSAPLGPFVEAPNSPILVTDHAKNISSPGHHAVFTRDGQAYIMYHRHSIPFEAGFVGRQVCIDPLRFTSNNLIEKVIPTHDGPPLVQGRRQTSGDLAAIATASSQSSPERGPERVLDDNYATRWAAAKDAQGAWLQLDLGAVKAVAGQELRFEYAWKPYRFKVEKSDDAQHWELLEDHTKEPASGSPIVISQKVRTRYLRLAFPESMSGKDISLFEWVLMAPGAR